MGIFQRFFNKSQSSHPTAQQSVHPSAQNGMDSAAHDAIGGMFSRVSYAATQQVGSPSYNANDGNMGIHAPIVDKSYDMYVQPGTMGSATPVDHSDYGRHAYGGPNGARNTQQRVRPRSSDKVDKRDLGIHEPAGAAEQRRIEDHQAAMARMSAARIDPGPQSVGLDFGHEAGVRMTQINHSHEAHSFPLGVRNKRLGG